MAECVSASPGPWAARPAENMRDVEITARALRPEFLATARPLVIARVSCGEFTDATGAARALNWANARLIAAAPDLLALVRDLLLDHQTVEPHHHDMCETCRRANAVIARAEGLSGE